MRKIIIYSCSLVMMAGLLCGCAGNHAPAENSTATSSIEIDSDTLDGTWNGSGYAIAQNENYDASFFKLEIKDGKEFQIEDASSNDPMITGKVEINSSGNLVFTVKELPAPDIQGWDEIDKKDTISSTMLNKDMMALSYDDICYIFKKSNSDVCKYSLLDHTLSDVWYSNDGSKKDDTTYELSISDTSFNLYKIKEHDTPTLLTTFVYENNKDDQFSFYTYIGKETEMPELFSDLPNGFSSVDLTMSIHDNELLLEYDGKQLPFYSNLIYGLETGSDAYTLCDTSFQWAFDSENHFCYFTMNPDTDTLYLYMSDGESPEYSSSSVCGEVAINQNTKTFTYHFDQDASELTAMPEEVIFEKCKSLDEKEIAYNIDEKVLTLTIDGENYNFNLQDY